MKSYPLKDYNRDVEEYDPTRDELDEQTVAKVARVATIYANYFKTELTGADHLPNKGGALIVSNHGHWGLDSPAMFARIYEQTGRICRGLAEHIIVKLPIIGPLMRSLGAVDGNPENAIRLLEAGELVVVYPGGHHDTFKPAEQRYQLQWDRARGYIRCAIRAQVPIVPIAGVGIDEAYVTVGHERRLGRWMFGRSDYDLPITLGLGLLPLPVKFSFHIGEPISLDASPEQADDPETVERLHAIVRDRTQDLIDRERGRRRAPTDP